MVEFNILPIIYFAGGMEELFPGASPGWGMVELLPGIFPAGGWGGIVELLPGISPAGGMLALGDILPGASPAGGTSDPEDKLPPSSSEGVALSAFSSPVHPDIATIEKSSKPITKKLIFFILSTSISHLFYCFHKE